MRSRKSVWIPVLGMFFGVSLSALESPPESEVPELNPRVSTGSQEAPPAHRAIPTPGDSPGSAGNVSEIEMRDGGRSRPAPNIRPLLVDTPLLFGIGASSQVGQGAVRSNLDPDRDSFDHDVSDLAVLQELIDLNQLAESSADNDYDDGDGVFEPLDLGYQLWQDDRLVALFLGPNRQFSFRYGIRALPASIGDLDRLRVLALGWNRLAALPDSIGNLTQLEELRIHDNQLTELPETIGRLHGLRILILGHNAITELPSALGDLQNLHALHLNDNPLSEVPRSLGDLRALRVLNVGHEDGTFGRSPSARLQVLPDSLEDLPALTTIYIERNRLFCAAPVPRLLTDGSVPRVYGLQHQVCASPSGDEQAAVAPSDLAS